MSAFRRGGARKRRDAAEGPIVEALRAVGATTWQLSGTGLPDLLVAYRGAWHVGEVKTEKGRLTPAQLAQGAGRLWPVWRTPDEALTAIGARR